MDIHKFQQTHMCFLVYTLELENGKFYCGLSSNLNQRLIAHISKQGAAWTKQHHIKRLIDVQISYSLEDALKLENKTTLTLMKTHGWPNVRGGKFCRCQMSAPPKKL